MSLVLGQEESLEEKMATHSSIFAWRIPWTEEPGRLQSIGLHRAGHDYSALGGKKTKTNLVQQKTKTEASKITILIFNDASKNSKESIIFPKKWHEAVHCMT